MPFWSQARAAAESLFRTLNPKSTAVIQGSARSKANIQAGNCSANMFQLVSEQQYAKILGYIEEGQKAGAKLRLGGKSLPVLNGQFIEPTIFEGVTPEMAIAREEIFGPVLSILAFDTAEEAIEIANETNYGLSASVWTRDLDTALSASRRIRAGTVWVNTFFGRLP